LTTVYDAVAAEPELLLVLQVLAVVPVFAQVAPPKASRFAKFRSGSEASPATGPLFRRR